jgi:hypothetical protein
MTHYTRKGYAYTGVSLIPQGCVKISFADYLSVSPIEILNTLISIPRCLAPQPHPLFGWVIATMHLQRYKEERKLQRKREKKLFPVLIPPPGGDIASGVKVTHNRLVVLLADIFSPSFEP